MPNLFKRFTFWKSDNPVALLPPEPAVESSSRSLALAPSAPSAPDDFDEIVILDPNPGVAQTVYPTHPLTEFTGRRLLQAIVDNVGSGGAPSSAVTIADGADITLGAKGDAAIVNPASSGSAVAFIKGLLTVLLAALTVKQLQLTGAPSNSTVGTTDATVFTLAAGEIGFIQNLSGADSLAVKKGAGASTSSFNFVLASGGAQDDGTGDKILIDDWIGAVSVAKIGSAARYIAWKQAP